MLVICEWKIFGSGNTGAQCLTGSTPLIGWLAGLSLSTRGFEGIAGQLMACPNDVNYRSRTPTTSSMHALAQSIANYQDSCGQKISSVDAR